MVAKSTDKLVGASSSVKPVFHFSLKCIKRAPGCETVEVG